MVGFARDARMVAHFGREEAEGRWQHRYLGPEHILVGLLVQGDNPAARLLRAHGLDLGTVRAGIDQLVADGVLPGPRPDDGELLATLGIDLEAVYGRLRQTFGDEAYYYAAQRVRLRRSQPVTHTPMGGTPMVCRRPWVTAVREAIARDQLIGSLHLLLGLLRDAADPAGTGLYRQERRRNLLLGLPDHGPSPIRLLVEAHGLTLETLEAAVLRELASPAGGRGRP
jgi:hypothetical protein